MRLLSEIAYFFTIRPRLNKLKKLLPEARIHPTGSRYVCSPPVLNTDIDFLVYTGNYMDAYFVELKLERAGYKKSVFDRYRFLELDAKFQAWRKGKVNLIVTSDLKYAESFHTATHICKARNVRRKIDRVIIHEILRGNLTVPESDPDFILPPLRSLLANFTGHHGHAFHKAYRAKHDLVL